MKDRVYGNAYRTTMICVDDGREGRFAGRLYNPYWTGALCFHGVMDFLKQMETQLDQMRQPSSFTARRAFAQPGTGEEQSPLAVRQQSGREATFSLRLLFRQNASWQGSVLWLETGQEIPFRSVLELLLLLNSALNREAAAAV